MATGVFLTVLLKSIFFFFILKVTFKKMMLTTSATLLLLVLTLNILLYCLNCKVSAPIPLSFVPDFHCKPGQHSQ